MVGADRSIYVSADIYIIHYCAGITARAVVNVNSHANSIPGLGLEIISPHAGALDVTGQHRKIGTIKTGIFAPGYRIRTENRLSVSRRTAFGFSAGYNSGSQSQTRGQYQKQGHRQGGPQFDIHFCHKFVHKYFLT